MSLRMRCVALLATVIIAPLLSGCVWVAATGAAVAGVSAARQERTVGDAVDDVRIDKTIQARLAKEKGGLFWRVFSNVVEGRVVLAGRVETPEARLEASRIAWSVQGVRKVDNDIEVMDSSGWLDGPSDLIIRTQLATVLLADKSIKDVNYTTDVVHGVVYLMGVGQDQTEVQRAVAHAEKISGVKRVENYVVLKNDPARYGYAGPPVQQ